MFKKTPNHTNLTTPNTAQCCYQNLTKARDPTHDMLNWLLWDSFCLFSYRTQCLQNSDKPVNVTSRIRCSGFLFLLLLIQKWYFKIKIALNLKIKYGIMRISILKLLYVAWLYIKWNTFFSLSWIWVIFG